MLFINYNIYFETVSLISRKNDASKRHVQATLPRIPYEFPR